MLTNRQKLVLGAIVDSYIHSAEPVGSRSISKRGDVAFSPATIRNEMSDLEHLGFLEQPHTSAGRIPSHKGYRYYVDHLLHLGYLSAHELDVIKTFLTDKMHEMELIVHQAATILSNLTNYTSIVLGPEVLSTTLKHLQLIPLNENTAIAIIVTSTGHVENKSVSIPAGVPVSEIEKLVRILNAKLKDVPLLQLKSKLYNEIAAELEKHVSHYEEWIQMIDGVLINDQANRIFLSGATNILTQPEFKDVEKVKTIFDLFDEAEALVKIFSHEQSGVQVRIGSENKHEAISNCSFITATYSIGGQPLGTIGILGPTRMEYGKVINLLNHLSKDIETILTRWY